ncbi:MAG: hypothetical protein V7642_7078 [Burkholderiales bacterium]
MRTISRFVYGLWALLRRKLTTFACFYEETEGDIDNIANEKL